MSEREFAAGHVFFAAGDVADCAYQLLRGQVELLTETSGSATRTRLIGPGEVFGEMALVDERPRPCSARAVTSGQAVPISRDEFEQHLAHDPARIRPFLRALFERLRSLAASSVGDSLSTAAARTESDALSPGDQRGELPTGAGATSDWVVVIHPLTHKAAETLPQEGVLVSRFPLRIGRASGVREPEALDLNDLWLLDEKPYHVSRNHCEITVDGAGLVVRDRGSQLGCIVNDKPIGGRSATESARLDPGENVLVVGARMSRYQFRLHVSPAGNP